jgi:hypothetical protein
MKKKKTSLSIFFFLMSLPICAVLIVTTLLEDACGCVYPAGYETGWGKIYYHPPGHFKEDVMILDEADYLTFQIIDNIYAKDKNHVYEQGEILPGADPKKFQSHNF